MSFASAVLTVHRQGRILVPTLRSIFAAREFARVSGHLVELVVVLDRADTTTAQIVDRFKTQIDRIAEVDFGDPGLARRYGINQTSHDYIFFHDADDLYATSWYVSFLTLVDDMQFDKSAVYHAEVVVGFGTERYFRLQTSSLDKAFDPMAMTVQWYFLTNLFAHRSMFDRFPIPQHDFESGLGHDDWAWSCDTLAGGCSRRVVAQTVSFYREKTDGVGKVPGIIHPPSGLFDPEYVRSDTRRRLSEDHTARPFPFGGTPDANDLSRERHVPEWVYDEICRQAVFEPLLTDLYDRQVTPPDFRLHPAMTGVAVAYRCLCEHIDNRPKIFLSLPGANVPMWDRFVEEIVAAFTAETNTEYQLIVFFDELEYQGMAEVLPLRHSATVICCDDIFRRYAVPIWVRSRFIARFYMQFTGSIVVDCGANVFRTILSEFYKPLHTQAKFIGMIYPCLRNDILSPIRINILQNIAAIALRPSPRLAVFSMSKTFAESVPVGAGVSVRVLPKSAARAWEELGLRRFAENEEIRSNLRDKVEFQQIADYFLDFDPADYTTTSGELEPIRRAVAVDERGRGLQSRVAIESTEGAWFSSNVAENAWHQFTATPAVSLLIPQVLFFSDELQRARFAWIDGAKCIDILRGMSELLGQQQVDIPFFVITRRNYGGIRLHSRLLFAYRSGGIAEMLGEIVSLTDRVVVAPLRHAICAQSASLSRSHISRVRHDF